MTTGKNGTVAPVRGDGTLGGSIPFPKPYDSLTILEAGGYCIIEDKCERKAIYRPTNKRGDSPEHIFVSRNGPHLPVTPELQRRFADGDIPS